MNVKKGDIVRLVFGINGAETVDYRATTDFNIIVMKEAALKSPFKRDQMLDTKNKYDGEPWFGEYLREEANCVEFAKEPVYSVALSGDTVKVQLRTALASNRNSKVR